MTAYMKPFLTVSTPLFVIKIQNPPHSWALRVRVKVKTGQLLEYRHLDVPDPKQVKPE